MGRVTVTLNNRTYRLVCGDGEEERLQALAAHLKQKVDALAQQFGQVGEDRLLLMAALLVTDELFDARDWQLTVDGDPDAPDATDAGTQPATAPTHGHSTPDVGGPSGPDAATSMAEPPPEPLPRPRLGQLTRSKDRTTGSS